MASNLPPGVTPGMIPGDTAEDAQWERFHERIDEDTVREGIGVEEAMEMWEAAMEVWRCNHKRGER